MLMPMRLRAVLVSVTLGAFAAPLAAQVGYNPAHSPYHDIAKGSSLTFTGGYFGGSGGSIGVGPNSAWTFGARWDFRAGEAVSFGAGVDRGSFERLLINPFLPVDQRNQGTVTQNVTMAQVHLQLNLTGGKSWNHFAPFVALSGGFAFAQRQVEDTSGFNFGNRFMFAPNAGVRIFLGDRLNLRGQISGVFWKIPYPVSFRVANPAGPPVLLDGRQSEWVVSPWFQFGLGYTL
jgi:hypothetical protein